MSDRFTLHLGDCLEVMRMMPDNSVDSIVTDPPYGLSDHRPQDVTACLAAWLKGEEYQPNKRGFMGRTWDSWVPGPEVWREAMRVLKPGGHILAFSGSRTMDLMSMAIRLAGFEIRDTVAWVYGSGFPKSADVSKQIDQQEKNRWIKISKAIDNTNFAELTELWIDSKSANAAGQKFQRKATEAGRNTQRGDSAQESVLLQASRESNDALAVIAELSLIEAHHTSVESCSSAQSLAGRNTTASSAHVTTAENSLASRGATLCMPDFSALQSAWGWQGGSIAAKLKAVEALKTWLGSKPSSRMADTDALCAALTDDLRLIMLSQSKTFLSFDTTGQMACASAISVTITESTAESLISFTVDTLRSKAIDRAAGAERGVIGRATGGCGNTDASMHKEGGGFAASRSAEYDITAPATDAARQWQGWGTSLKPAFEPCIMARKPLIGTVAENVLQHGTGAINIDGCRVGAESTVRRKGPIGYGGGGSGGIGGSESGRFPANLIHDGSPEVLAIFPDSAGSGGSVPNTRVAGYGAVQEYHGGERQKHDAGSGSAARFFKQIPVQEDIWEDVELPFLDANTAGGSLSLQRQAAVSALVVAANAALPEGLYCESLCLEPSTSATGSELRLIAGSVMQTIQIVDSRFWPESKPARLSLSLNRVSVAASLGPTGTTTITLSHWKSDGSADPVTFSIMRQNLGVGEKDCGQSTASRLIYCAKASERDRDEGLEGFLARKTNDGRRVDADNAFQRGSTERLNVHPTVKPTDLMRYLCRLITPPGGTVLDPFMGSGSTGKAAMLEGFRFIGCEMDPEYWLIAHARIDAAAKSCNIGNASTTEEE